MDTAAIAATRTDLSTGRQLWNFVRHYVEMCLSMCVGIALGDAMYFALAKAFGYGDPLGQLPVLSLVVLTVSMTLPMVGWMRFRGMGWRLIDEMAASMVVLAVVVLGAGLLGLVPMDELALLAHGLMMPAMLVPMLLRLDHYAGRSGHMAHA